MAKSNESTNKKHIGKKAKPVPVSKPEVGIETDAATLEKLLDAAELGNLDIGSLQSFSSASQSREYVYTFIDSMALDDRVSSVLEVYTSDATEPNDSGKIVWAESDDADVSNTINYFLDAINVDKHAHEWMYSFIKYGDIYLRTFRESDFAEDTQELPDGNVRSTLNESKGADSLNEDVLAKVHEKDDHYVHYVEIVDNPGDMFDLTKHGKTVLYIDAPANVTAAINTQTPAYAYQSYKIKQSDVTVYEATDFVHASLTNENSIRSPEKVVLFNDDDELKKGVGNEYTVNKGQSLLYNLFKVWRQLSLIEDSLIVNRATRSSLVRMMMVEIGDMPADRVQNYLQRLKHNIEQKVSLSLNKGMQEYNNAGPVENTIYIPTHNGQGAITPATVGGDYDPKQLTDLDYFINKFYGSVGIPKQYFSFTDDGAGFNGGASLSIISSRYAKNVKKFQSKFCQLITDLINLFLIDKGMENYIDKFSIKMQPPITQEEIDKRENQRNKIGIIGDVMNQVDTLIDDDVVKLKILNKLLTQSLSDSSVPDTIQEYIDKLEAERDEEDTVVDETPDEVPSNDDSRDEVRRARDDVRRDVGETGGVTLPEPQEVGFEATQSDVDSYLPSASELGVDMVDNA